MTVPLINPYKKGKSKLIAGLMLEGWSNEKIINHIMENKLDERFKNPVDMQGIYKVRTMFNKTGLTEQLKQREAATVPAPQTGFQEPLGEGSSTGYPGESEVQREVPSVEAKNNERFQIAPRPEWDLIPLDQINNIEDIVLRTQILEYRSNREKLKQELTPDYATSEQFDSFRSEIQENLQSFDGRLNSLKESISETIVETFNKMQHNNPAPQQLEPEVAEGDAIYPSMDLETENPLDTTADSVIELEGSIISKKTVGFTPKSLMLFDLTRKKGFRGNFADFVNSCISAALKGRKFKLTVEEDIE